jgi:hypothetical protein
MTLFAILGIPCLVLGVGLWQARSPRRLDAGAPAWGRLLGLRFLIGFLYGLLGMVVVLLLRRYLPLSYRPLPLYLYYAGLDHLVPALLLLLVFLLFLRDRGLLELLAFSGGFYALLAMGLAVADYGQYQPYDLFLRPALWMGTVLVLPLTFRRSLEWDGGMRILLLVLTLAIPLAAGAVSFLYVHFLILWAIVGTVVFLGASLGFLYYEAGR